MLLYVLGEGMGGGRNRLQRAIRGAVQAFAGIHAAELLGLPEHEEALTSFTVAMRDTRCAIRQP